MAGLSTAASVISVIQLASEVIRIIGTCKGAREERKCLREEIRACCAVLQQLEDNAQDCEAGAEWTTTLRLLEKPLVDLHTCLNELKDELQPATGLRAAGKIIEWPFKVKDVEKSIKAIERQKSLLALALINGSRKLAQEVLAYTRTNAKTLGTLLDATEKSSLDHKRQFQDLKDNIESSRQSQLALSGIVNDLNERDQRKCLSDDYRVMLEWLSPINYALQHATFVDTREKGTGQWFLESNEYRQWYENFRQTLFCTGMPGAGKTILTSIVIDDLLRRSQILKNVGVAYIYCHFQRQNEQTVIKLLANLLKQLSRKANFHLGVCSLHAEHAQNQTYPSVEEISDALIRVASSYSKTYVVIDALDELALSDGTKNELLSVMAKVQKCSKANVFMTSRLTSDNVHIIGRGTAVQIRAHEADVHKYVEGRMSDFRAFVNRDEVLKAEVAKAIASSSQGMFLLARLNILFMSRLLTPKTIREALLNLPSGSDAYNQVYEGAMTRIKGQYPNEVQLATQTLMWITCAKRLLTISEIQHALAVELDKHDFDRDNIPQVDDIVSVCAGLVTVEENSGVIRLVHYTTQEFLTRTQERWFPGAETKIATTCVKYLSYHDLNYRFYETDLHLPKETDLYPFYDYASRFWVEHDGSASSESNLRLTVLLSNNPNLLSACLVWASRCQDISTVMLLLQREPNVNKLDKEWKTALHYAVIHGWAECVKMLLDLGATCSPDIENMTPLHHAVLQGHENIVEILLDGGIPIDLPVKRKIWRSTWKGGRRIWRPSYDPKIPLPKINVRTGLTPLHFAALSGSVKMAGFLLNRGANPAAVSEYGETPLHLALKQDLYGQSWHSGNEDFWNSPEHRVECILDYIDFEDEIDYSHAQSCIEQDRFAMIDIILAHHNIDLATPDLLGNTVLHCVRYGTANTHKVLDKLCQSGANICRQDSSGRTALHLACDGGDANAVNFILAEGANILALDKKRRNAFHYAVKNGSEAVVLHLLTAAADTGINQETLVTARDIRGRNPMHYLFDGGFISYATVLHLVKSEAGLNDVDIHGKTPLATLLTHFLLNPADKAKMAKLLLQNGTDPHFTWSEDVLGLGHLSAHADQLGVEVLQVLAEHGVDLQSCDNKGRSILHHSAIHGSLTEDALRYLCMEIGLRPDRRDKSGKTPTEIATEEKNVVHDPRLFRANRWAQTERLLCGEALVNE